MYNKYNLYFYYKYGLMIFFLIIRDLCKGSLFY